MNCLSVVFRIFLAVAGTVTLTSCSCNGERRWGDAEENPEMADMVGDSRVDEILSELYDGLSSEDTGGEETASDLDICGNSICEAGESCSSCPTDCGRCSCGNGTCDPGEDGCTCRADCECTGNCDYSLPPTDDQPLILYYGILTEDGHFSENLNRLLVEKSDGSGNLTDTMEIVFSGSGGILFSARGRHDSCKPPEPPFSTIKSWGARVAYNFIEVRLRCCLLGGTPCTQDSAQLCDESTGYGVDATATVIENLLRDGYDYIAVDEIKDFGETGGGPYPWRNGNAASNALLNLLDRLNADGYDRRIILWFEYKTTQVYLNPDTGNGRLANYSAIFNKCQDRCRKMVFELYGTNTAWDPGVAEFLSTQSVTAVPTAARYIDWLALRLHRIADGTNVVSMAGIGLGPDSMNNHACDLTPQYPPDTPCPRDPDGGGLYNQFAWMHNHGDYQKHWKGVGFFSLGRAQETAAEASQYTMVEFCDALYDFTRWWH